MCMSIRIRTALVTAVAVPLLGGILVACNSGGDGEVLAQPTGSATTMANPSGPPDQSPQAAVTVSAYYLAEVVTGGEAEPIREIRLFREFHKVAQRDGSDVVTAIYELFGDKARDPDYASVWPAMTRIRAYTKSGDTATVDLSAEARNAKAGAEVEERSIQQLVYTITAADNSVRAVRLLVEGRPIDTLWGHSSVSGPLEREPEIDVLAHIWLQTAEGQTVPATFAFGGVGTAFEGTVNWDVQQNGRTVKEGFAQAGAGPKREKWQASVTLPPGTYVLRAYEISAANGSTTNLDTKRITVR
jgi:hypothetical protein